MNRKEFILEHSEDYFTRDKSGKGYICPICGSGSGDKGTGITENPQSKGHFTCWAGCFTNADIFEIIGRQYNLTDFGEQFKKACEVFGITSDEVDEPDYTDFINMASMNLAQTDYHRGISLKTLQRFKVGFVANWRHPKAPSVVPASPRLIIPLGRDGYLARDVRLSLTPEEKKYSKSRVGKAGLFNSEALRQESTPVFITEGEIDALSIIDAGGQAVGLGSIANIGRLAEAVMKRPPEVPLLIALDNDERGQKASGDLADKLKNAGFSLYRKYPLPASYKDANDFYVRDREQFIDWVQAGEALKEILSEDETEFESEAVSFHLNDFLEAVKKNREGKAIPTGFPNLDELFDGGLYPGLYFIGGNSSLGKTSLIWQICDYLAQSGQGVLFFSLEMSTNELIAKTLSRLSLMKSIESYGTTQYAKTTRGVLMGRYNEIESELLSEAISEYSEWGKNVYVIEGMGDVGTAQIRKKVEEFIKFKGVAPVVVIDYAQILAPAQDRLTDKQAVDKNVVELKRISRDYQVPVIGISSLNRENYKAPISMTAFKESGSLEYSSDVLLGLQYYGWDFEAGESEKERALRLHEISDAMSKTAVDGKLQVIQLKVLKNRNGRRGDVLFNFSPKFNYFCPREV